MANDDCFHINAFPSIGWYSICWQDPFPDHLPKEEESEVEDEEEGNEADLGIED